jgi:hypothetical protein
MEPIKEVFAKLREYDFDVSGARALEVFGRCGDWHTQYYQSLVGSLEVWEIDSIYREDLKKNLPNAAIKITDSYQEILSTTDKFDIIVIDNPQSIFGDRQFCEHFDLFPDILQISAENTCVILNINFEPYNFHQESPWYKRRQQFYATDNPEKLKVDEVIETYKRIAESNGFVWNYAFLVPRNSFISYLCFCISRRLPVE